MSPSLAPRVAEDLGLGRLEDPDELAADDLALLLGVGDPGERVEEPLLGVDDLQLDAGGGDEVALDLLGLALAHQPVVDEHAGQPVADGALDERGGDRGVDAAGEAADRLAASPIWSRIRSICSSTMLTIVQVGRQPAIWWRKCSSTCWPCWVCMHLGVPLDAGQPAVDVLEGGDRRDRGGGEHREPLGRGGDRVAVGHPDGVLGGDVGEQGAGLDARVTRVRPYSRAPVCATSPPRPRAISWKP